MSQTWIRFWLVPTALFALLVLLLEAAGLDLVVADHIYQLQGGEWALRRDVLLEDILHEGGRAGSQLLAVAVGTVLITARLTGRGLAWRRDLERVLLAAIVSVALVNLIKVTTQIPCPWHLSRYGGELPWLSPLTSLLQNSGRECFPAGHASGAYGWLGAYFFARKHWPAGQYLVLAGIVVVGLIFGIAQQLRGAHFLSHDLWTIWLCWSIAFAFRPATSDGGCTITDS